MAIAAIQCNWQPGSIASNKQKWRLFTPFKVFFFIFSQIFSNRRVLILLFFAYLNFTFSSFEYKSGIFSSGFLFSSLLWLLHFTFLLLPLGETMKYIINDLGKKLQNRQLEGGIKYAQLITIIRFIVRFKHI